MKLPRVLNEPVDIDQPLYVSTHYFGPTGDGTDDGAGADGVAAAATGTLGRVLERWVVRFDRHEDATIATLPQAGAAFRRGVALLLRVLLVRLRLAPVQRLVLALRKNVAARARLRIDCAPDSAAHGPFLGEEYRLVTLASVRARYGVLSVFALHRDDLAPLLAEAALSLHASAIIPDYDPHASPANTSSAASSSSSSSAGSSVSATPRPILVPAPGAGAAGAAAGTAPSWRSPVFGGSLLGSLRSVPAVPTMPRPPLVPGSYHSVQPRAGTLYVVGRANAGADAAAPAAAGGPQLPPLEFAAPPRDSSHGNSDKDDDEDEEEQARRPRFLSSVPIDRVPLLSMYTPFSGVGAGRAGAGVGRRSATSTTATATRSRASSRRARRPSCSTSPTTTRAAWTPATSSSTSPTPPPSTPSSTATRSPLPSSFVSSFSFSSCFSFLSAFHMLVCAQKQNIAAAQNSIAKLVHDLCAAPDGPLPPSTTTTPSPSPSPSC